MENIQQMDAGLLPCFVFLGTKYEINFRIAFYKTRLIYLVD